ncbi:MAG: cyclic nucleotide-binding domain-containing protein [Myxococcaceae bacterium]|nr:cyclic nucleotide-binding domain-containing protein [Myxococcaceae bacterium]
MHGPSLYQRFAATPLCEGLAGDEVSALFELCEQRHFEPSAALFTQGQPGDALWIILEGDVEVSRDGAVLAEVGPGAALGELSLLRETPTRSATARALCPVVAVRLPTTAFRKRLVASDTAALKVVSNLAHQLADRLVALNDRLLSGGRKGLSVARTELRRLVR